VKENYVRRMKPGSFLNRFIDLPVSFSMIQGMAAKVEITLKTV